MCSYCGVQWRRSQLRRDAAGNLACPDDAPGLDVVSLSEGNARMMRSQAPRSVGPSDGAFDDFVSPADPGFVDPNGPPAPLVNGGPTGALSVRALLWVRSDNVLQAKPGRAARWPDMSGSGNDESSATEALQPSVVAADATLGGLPTVAGDGAQWLRSLSFGDGAPLWAWLIFKPNTTSTSVLLDAGVQLFLNPAPGTAALATNAGIVASVPMVVGQWSRAMLVFDVTGTFAVTDSLQVRGTVATAVSVTQITSPTISLLNARTGTLGSDASIAEALVTRGPPTAEEIAAIEAYGVARYGGTLFA